ncbi:hypothetical protein ACS96_03830 [Pseudomonas aeruginosa]|nr:hypothetical protein ACS96_03830 [Pseudomonas aeruginosa]
MMPADLPRHATAAHCRGDLLPQPLFDRRPPRHQAKSHTVIEHRVAPARQHDGAPVDASHTLPVRDGLIHQAGFGGNVLCGLRQFSIAQRSQQIARQDHALPAPLSQPLFGQEVGALLQSVLGIAAKAHIAQPTPAADQLLVKPGRTDDAGLPLDGQVRFQLYGHAA